MTIRTVKVSNVSLGATRQDITEFFSFSGDIQDVVMQSDTERSQSAFVTFKDSQGAETAVLLSGATIVDLAVTITLDPDYQPPPAALAESLGTENKAADGSESAFQKGESFVSRSRAKSFGFDFVFAKDAFGKVKSFDEKHQLTSTATAKVASFNKKIGLSKKISVGTSAVNEKVREVDQKFQVSEKAKSAFAVAEQKVSSAGSAIIKNRYVLTGAAWVTAWVTGAFNKVAKAARVVGQKSKEKVGMAEEEQRREMLAKRRRRIAQIHSSDSPTASAPNEQQQSSKPAPAQGLIL